MERLTRKNKSINSYVLKDPSAMGCMDAVDKLGNYEDLEEQGLLFKIPRHCKDCAHVNYEGCAGTTCYCMKNGCFMQNDDFCIYAEQKLKETTGGQHKGRITACQRELRKRMKARNNQ